MAKTGARDLYANKFFGQATESAANTLTFNELQTHVSVFEKQAWVLSRLEWYVPTATIALLIATADTLEVALTSSDQITHLGLDNPSVIDVHRMGIMAPSDVTAFVRADMPIIRDWTNLPGGGLIIAPRPLFVGIQGVSLTAAATIHCRGYFRQMTLNAEEYIELIDFYRIVS